MTRARRDVRVVGVTITAAAVLGVVVLGLIAGVTLVQRWESQRASARDSLVGEARIGAVAADELVRSSFRELEAVTASGEIRSGDPAQVAAVLDRVVGGDSRFTAGFTWIDRDGVARLLISDDVEAISIPVGDRDYVAAALRGERFVGRAVESRIDGRPVLPIAVPAPGADGRPVGILTGGIALAEGDPAITGLGGDGRTVIDRDGRIVASRNRSLVLEPAAGDLSSLVDGRIRSNVVDPEGDEHRTVAAASVPAAGWIVVVASSTDELYGPANRDLQVGIAIVAAVSLTVLVGALQLARRLQRRHDTLQRSAQRAAREREELDRLAAAMAELAAAHATVDVAHIVVERALPALGVQGARLSLCDPDRPGELVNVASGGWSRSVTAGWDRFTVTRGVPVGDAVLDRHPVFVTASELPSRFPEAAPTMLATGDAAWASLPLTDADTVLGVMSISFSDAGDLDEEMRVRLVLLAGRVSAALQRVTLQEAEHRLTLEVQETASAGNPDTVDGITLDLAYLPANHRIDMGGDWCDTIRLDDRRLVVFIGDITGHGIRAAVTVSRIRGAVRALAPLRPEPDRLLDELDQVSLSEDELLGASAVALLIDTGRRTLTWSIAGHPPPLLLGADGSRTWLEYPRGPLIGLARRPRPIGTAPLGDVRALLLYTDGLVERRGEVIDTGLDRLRHHVESGVLPARQLAERQLGTIQRRDDALVVWVINEFVGWRRRADDRAIAAVDGTDGPRPPAPADPIEAAERPTPGFK